MESQSRWIYLPSSKQVRRIVGSDESSAPILGSELSTEDLDLSQVDGATAKIVNRAAGVITIESKISSKESAYSGCKAEFDETTRLMKSAQCADREPGEAPHGLDETADRRCTLRTLQWADGNGAEIKPRQGRARNPASGSLPRNPSRKSATHPRHEPDDA